MTVGTILLLAIGALAIAGSVCLVFAHRRPATDQRAAERQERHIQVRGGYHPAEIHVSAGRPVRLVFRREETARCSERVVFPSLGISAALPAFRDTAIDLPASEPGTRVFTCEMEMLHGRLIVDATLDGDDAPARDLTAAPA